MPRRNCNNSKVPCHFGVQATMTHKCTQTHTSKRHGSDKNVEMLAEQSSDDGLVSAVDQQQEQQQQQQLTAQQLQYLQQLLRKNNDALLAVAAAEGSARNARSTRSADVYAAVLQRRQGQAAHDGVKASEVTNVCSLLGALTAATQQAVTPEQATRDSVASTPVTPADCQQALHDGQQQPLPLQKRDMTTAAAAAAHGGAKTTAFVAAPVTAQTTPTVAAVALPFAPATAPPYVLPMMGGMPAPMHTMPPSMMPLPGYPHGLAQPPLQYLRPPQQPMFPPGTLHPAMYAHAPPLPPPPPMPAAGGGGSFGGMNGYVNGHTMLSGVMPPYGVGVPVARAEGLGVATPPLPFLSPDLLAAMSQAAAATRPSADANMTAIMSALAAQTQLMLRRQQVYEQQLALMRELLAQQQTNSMSTSSNNNNNSDNDGKSDNKDDKQGDVCGGTSCAGDANGSSSPAATTAATPSHQQATCTAATATSLLSPPTATTTTRSTHDGIQFAVHGAVHDEVACATTTAAAASMPHTADASSNNDMMHLWNNLHFDMDDNAYNGNDTGNCDAVVHTQATAVQPRALPQAPLPCYSDHDNDDDDDGDDERVADVVGRLAQHNDAAAAAGVVASMCASAAAGTTTTTHMRRVSHTATLPAALEFLQLLDDTDDDGNNNDGKSKGKSNNSKQKQQQKQKQKQKQKQQQQQSTAFVSQGSASLRATDTSVRAPSPHGTSPPPYTEAVKQRPLPPPPSPPPPPSYRDKSTQQLTEQVPWTASDYVKVRQLPVPCTAVANATDKAASRHSHHRKQRRQEDDKDKYKGRDDGGAAATLAKSTTTKTKMTTLQCAVKVCAAYCNILREVTQFAVESSEEIMLNHCKKTALCRNPAWPPHNERAVHSLLKSCNAPKLLRHLIILSYAHRSPTSLEDLKAHWTECKVAHDPVFAAYYLYVKIKCNMRLCIRHNSHHNIHGNTDGRCNYAEQHNIDRCRYEHLCLFCGKDTHGWYDENNCKDYQHLVYEARRLGVTEDDMDTLLRGMEGGRVTGL